MKLVQDHDDVLRNISEFSAALNGDSYDREYASMLVRKGHVFYPFIFNGVLGYAPSKFIGYDGNTIKKYRRSTKVRSGSITTAKISQILNLWPQQSQNHENQLRTFCGSLGQDLAKYKHSFWKIPPVDVGADRNSAIDDLDDGRTENDDPKYRDLMARYYIRDDKVRAAVKKRADGKCEFCEATPFEGRKGIGFVECHHVVGLSAGGADKVTNVIGLCPNHHREAHLGQNWEELNLKFDEILKRIAS